MSKTSDLGTRFGVAMALIAGAAFTLYWGGTVFWLVLAVTGLLMMSEWGELAGAELKDIRLSQYALSVPLAAMCPFAGAPYFLSLGLIGGAMFFTGAVLRSPRLALGIVYVALPVLALIVLRDRPQGLLVTFWAMGLVWAADSAAYFAGRAIGGPKLAPAISPKKTWAGVIGGVLGATIGAFGLVWLFGLPAQLAYVTPLLAILSVFGDLFESNLKRQAGVKDSGKVLPGHGGLLDRLDGLVFAAPPAALLVLVLT
ncbi:phosphatidate cytidylyltransferase [Sphingomonas soli]|uniref:phosphatidate cytidylyltransferase n=1 Tax=Sphingomonas soli TaxID=266127 RepID=UPI000A066E00|nr:phosphatidate cytidylyltransferase [Sphingomonas soli]